MREAMAISIVLIAFDFFKNKKYIIFSILVLLASTFHFSAIVFFMVIPFSKIKFSKKNIFISIIVFILLFIYGETIFILLSKISPRLSDYINSVWGKGNLFGALFNFLVIAFQLIFGVLIYNKNKKININQLDIYFSIMIIATAISILVMRATIFDRFLSYFSIFTIIWTPNCILQIKNSKKKLLYIIIIFTLFLLYFIVIGTFRPEWNGAIPYVFGY